MLLESESAVKKLWAIRTIGEGRSFHGKRRWESESQSVSVIWERYQQRYGSGYISMQITIEHTRARPAWPVKSRTENDSRLLKNSERNRHGNRNFCQGKEADIA